MTIKPTKETEETQRKEAALEWTVIVVLAIAFACLVFTPMARGDDLAAVRQHVETFHRNVGPQKRNRALALVPLVIEAAHKAGIDPLLLAHRVSAESSWRQSVVGDAGERGLVQVHGVAAKGYDLTTPRGQLEAGAAWLRACLDMCNGDLTQSITAYRVGRCKTTDKRVQNQVRRFVKRYQKEKMQWESM
jgi:soluble lytic murein transglycosylase-like protein